MFRHLVVASTIAVLLCCPLVCSGDGGGCASCPPSPYSHDHHGDDDSGSPGERAPSPDRGGGNCICQGATCDTRHHVALETAFALAAGLALVFAQGETAEPCRPREPRSSGLLIGPISGRDVRVLLQSWLA